MPTFLRCRLWPLRGPKPRLTTLLHDYHDHHHTDTAHSVGARIAAPCIHADNAAHHTAMRPSRRSTGFGGYGDATGAKGAPRYGSRYPDTPVSSGRLCRGTVTKNESPSPSPRAPTLGARATAPLPLQDRRKPPIFPQERRCSAGGVTKDEGERWDNDEEEDEGPPAP